MANISITDAAAAGFAIARRKPAALVAWAGVGLVMLIATMVVFYVMGGEHLKALVETMQEGAPADPQEALALYRPLFPAYGVAFCISLGIYSIIIPAVYRAVLQPETKSPGYLRLGRAELNQFLVMAIILSAVIGIDLAIGYILRAVMGTDPSPIAVLANLAAFALLVFVLVRLSLAGPDTLAKGRVSLMGSWTLSKGSFWPMLSAYALVVLFQIMIAVSLVIVMGVVMGGSAAAMNLGAAGAVIALVLTVLYLVAVCLIYALSIAVMNAPAAQIYRELTAQQPGIRPTPDSSSAT